MDILISQPYLKEKLLNLYAELPRTGLYDTDKDINTQVNIFITYLRFLKKQLYDGPRYSKLREIQLQLNTIINKNPVKSNKLFKLMKLSELDIFYPDFPILMTSYITLSDEKNAGKNYDKYMKAFDRSISDPYTNEKINEIRKKLMKVYDEKKTEEKIQEILSNYKHIQKEQENIALYYHNILKTDIIYLEWIEIINLWKELEFDKLMQSYIELDKNIGIQRKSNGDNLETICIDILLQNISHRSKIPIGELNILRNIKVRKSKNIIGEIDIIVYSIDTIVACVEVKSGIYDIGYAINQLKRIKDSPVHEIMNKKISSDTMYLIVTTIPNHKPVTGACYSDIQNISKILFNRSDSSKWINTIIENNNINDMNYSDIYRIYLIITDIRSKMESLIDPIEAVKELGSDLIII